MTPQAGQVWEWRDGEGSSHWRLETFRYSWQCTVIKGSRRFPVGYKGNLSDIFYHNVDFRLIQPLTIEEYV